MKKRHILSAISLSITLGLGVFAGLALTNKKAVQEVKATSGDTYYLVGATKAGGASEIGWATEANSFAFEDGGAVQTIEFEEGDEFKFILPGGWEGALGANALLGSARGYFGGTDNIVCNFGGNYKVNIKDSKVIIDCYSTQYASIYVQLKSYATTYVYAFDETTNPGYKLEPLGGWPGTVISEYTNGVDYAANYSVGGGIGKMDVPYIGLSNTKVVISDGAGQQSGDCTLGKHAFIWEGGTVSDTSEGALAQTVYEISKVIEGAVNQSACNVTQEAASKVLNDNSSYLNYSRVKTSTIYTWTSPARESKANYQMSDVIALLQEIAAGGSGSRSMVMEMKNNSTLTIVIVCAAAIVTSSLLFFFIRKRKLEK